MPDTNSPSISPYAERLARLARQVARHHLDALIILNPTNRFYLTGLSSTNGIVIVLPGEEALFYTDFRYYELARKSVESATVRRLTSIPDQMGPLARRMKWQRVGFEGSSTVLEMKALRDAIPSVAEWVECGSLILDMRARKSRAEQEAIRQAMRRGDSVFRHTVETITPGMTEWDIRRILRGWVDHLDAEQESFDCIISVGSNASKPHAKVTQRVWRRGQPLLVDMGVQLNHYCSDMTRMVFAGAPPKQIIEIYNIVLDAQEKAIAAIRAGRAARDIDAIARKYIAKHGYGNNFGHNLGHGLGLEIHESPRLSPLSDSILRPGMVVTVEPGIYLPGIGGVRIEDVVIVRESGCENLTGTTKEMIVL